MLESPHTEASHSWSSAPVSKTGMPQGIVSSNLTASAMTKKLLADFLFLLHGMVFFVVLYGWFVPSLQPLFVATLIIILIQNIFLNYCLLSKWEFNLRKALNPNLEYNYNFTSYYIHKFTDQTITPQFMRIAGIIFPVVALTIIGYFQFFYA